MAIREEQGTSDQNQLDFAQIMATSSMAQINPFNPADPHVKIMLIGKIDKLKNKWGGGIDLEVMKFLYQSNIL